MCFKTLEIRWFGSTRESEIYSLTKLKAFSTHTPWTIWPLGWNPDRQYPCDTCCSPEQALLVKVKDGKLHGHATEALYCIPVIYSFAIVCAFFKIGSIRVAFVTSPLIVNLPDMNSCIAFALPLKSLPNSSSANIKVTKSSKSACVRLAN